MAYAYNYMMDYQEQAWDVLCDLSGEEVLQALTNYHGLQLLSRDFLEFLIDEGYTYE